MSYIQKKEGKPFGNPSQWAMRVLNFPHNALIYNKLYNSKNQRSRFCSSHTETNIIKSQYCKFNNFYNLLQINSLLNHTKN